MLSPADLAASRGRPLEADSKAMRCPLTGQIQGTWHGSVEIQPGVTVIQGQVVAKSKIR